MSSRKATQAPANTAGALPPAATECAELRSLLAAIREAIALPFHTADYERRLVERVSWARTVADAVLDNPGEDIGWNADYLRSKLTAEQAEAAEREKNKCGRCRQPFDPTDTRFDGHARHGETPWCRWCVDRCHESTDAFHACPICDPNRRGGEGQ
ncbi:hypothetical protein ACH47Z_18300 [Streptomyces sp. NPDC020192]|uniref:hypothetical protein n=1 Tax=Streptomyces sp. NPDC020192 TaxID=3365066 RepID=UPI0037B17D44